MKAARDPAPGSPALPARTAATPNAAARTAAPDSAAPHPAAAHPAGSPVLNGPGQPVPADVRARLERSFGATLGHVRLHTGTEGDRLAAAFGARAVTLGSHIALSGEAPTGTLDGYRTLAHEITHVLQQGPTPAGAVKRTRPGDALERSAARTAATVAAGGLADPVATVGQPLLACDMGPFDYGRAALNWVGKAVDKADKLTVTKLISGVEGAHKLVRDKLDTIRARIPEGWARAEFDGAVGSLNLIVESFKGLLYALTGLTLGVIEAILGSITGLLRIANALVEFVIDLLLYPFDHGERAEQWWKDTVHQLSLIPAGLNAIADEYRSELQHSTPAEGAVLMGKMVGQIVVFIGTVGAGAAKAGNVAEATNAVSKLTAVLDAAKPAVALAEGGELAGASSTGLATTIVKGGTVVAGGVGAGTVTVAGKDPAAKTEPAKTETQAKPPPSKVPPNYTIQKVTTPPADVPEPPVALEFPNGTRVWRARPGGPVMQEADLGRGTVRAGFERQNYSATEHGRPPGPAYERSHSLGQGTGWESPYAVWDAPRYVNQTLQNHGIEQFMRNLYASRQPGETFRVVVESEAAWGTRRFSRIRYEITSVRPGGVNEVAVYEIQITGTEANPVVSALPITFADNPVAQTIKSSVPQPKVITQAVRKIY